MTSSTKLDIQFTNYFRVSDQGSEDTWPLFIAADGIHGFVNINYDTASPTSYNNDVVSICAYGKFDSRSAPGGRNSDGTPKSSTFQVPLFSLVDVVLTGPTTTLIPPSTHKSARFDITLPKALTRLDDDYGPVFSPKPAHWSVLPSSLSVRMLTPTDPYSPARQFEAKTSYIVQAHVFRDRKVIASVSKDVSIFDTMEPLPPTCLSDFPSEYRCQQERALRKRIFTKVGIFSATIAEPEPFVFYEGRSSVLTRLPIRFTVKGLGAGGRDITVVPSDATITWQLKTSTIVSTKPMDFVPTLRQADRTPSITLITRYGIRHQLKIALSDWKKVSNSPGATVEDVRQITEQLAMLIPARSLLPPTFFTPQLIRKYSITVQVKMAGHGKSCLRLEVPVQIVYRTQTGETGAGLGEAALASTEAVGSERARQILAVDAAADLPMYLP